MLKTAAAVNIFIGILKLVVYDCRGLDHIKIHCARNSVVEAVGTDVVAEQQF